MLTVGEILRKEREKQNITLEQVEKKINVRRKFLQAVEDNDWTLFASKIYIIGVLKNYARVLGLPHDKVIAFFRREYGKKETVGFKTKVSSSFLNSDSKFVLWGIVAAIFLTFAVYFGYQLTLYFSPPKITILEPTNTRFRKVTGVEVKAKADRESQIMIFGNRVYQNKDGVFTYHYPLKKGTNEFVVEVVGPNGKKTVLKQIYILE